MDKKIFEHIATPDQIPNSIGEDRELEEVIRTNSLREFANQNKDLSARLSVQLRRNAELEAHINRLGEKIKSLKQQNEEISNNGLKNRQLAQFHQKELEEANEKLKQTEIELGQTHLLYRNLQVSHEQGLTETDRIARCLRRYRRRIQKYVRPRLNRLIEQNYSLLSQFRDLQIENSAHKEQLEVTKYVLDREKNKHKSKIASAADLQDEIIATYDKEMRDLQSLLDQREIELTESENKRRYLENIRDKYVVMENKSIAAERMRFEIEKKYDEKISELRTTIIELRESHKEEKQDFAAQKKMLEILREENDELSQKYFESSTIASTTRGDNQAKFVQLSQVKIEKSKLEKQVEELSNQIRSMKTENKSLRNKVEELSHQPKLPETFPQEMELFTVKAENIDTTKSELNPPAIGLENLTESLELSTFEFEEMTEIDRLIKEIELGYPITPKELDK